jgi:hypothetical protein
VVTGFLLAVEVPQLMAKNSVHPMPVNGKVLLAYSNSVPTKLTFQGRNGNYSAVLGDITGSCACGGYYFMISVPDSENYNISIYYTRNNSTNVCQTKLTVPAESGSLNNQLIRCP